MATLQLINEHRRDLAYLIGLASTNLLDLWVFGDDFLAAREGLTDILPEMVDTYGSAASALGADWYEEYREESGVTDRFTAFVAPLPDRGRTDALAGWATTFTDRYDPAAAQQKVLGGLQRIVADADRDTILESTKADPKAHGWRRNARANGCSFCRMVAGRGVIFKHDVGRFASHDHCMCTVVPAWGGEAQKVDDYVPTTRDITDADRARVRQWLRDNPDVA